ncbi:putative mitochondrial protein, partial [Mucuna pruriens]
MQAPCVDHWTAVLRILKYIKKTPGQGLLYEDKGDTHISCYCDADWAGSPIDRRSTIGFCISIGGNVVSWKSKKQNTVARSSAEAEYRAMTSATCELIWVRDQIHQAGFHVDADTTDRKIQKKVREAQLAQYNYILVVGEEEANTGQKKEMFSPDVFETEMEDRVSVVRILPI